MKIEQMVRITYVNEVTGEEVVEFMEMEIEALPTWEMFLIHELALDTSKIKSLGDVEKIAYEYCLNSAEHGEGYYDNLNDKYGDLERAFKAAEFEAEREKQKAEEVTVEQHNDTFIVEAPQGAFAFIVGRDFQIGYKDEHGEYFFEKLTFKGWFNATDSLLFDDEQGNTLHLNPLGITYVWIKLEEPKVVAVKQLAKLKAFERYNDLLMKSLKDGLTAEESEEYNMLYSELKLHEGNNLYNLLKLRYEQ